jgi:FKBP-type peptidyl-prolyl cis-trans isomerase (trigger factor)
MENSRGSMQVLIEEMGPLKRKLSLQLAQTQLAAVEQQELERYSKEAKNLPGFRPGKVPLKLLKQRYGHVIHERAINTLINTTLQEALRDHNLHPVGRPEVTWGDECGDRHCENVHYEAIFEVFPDFSLVDYSKVILERQVVQVTDEDVEQALQKVDEGQRPDAAVLKENLQKHVNENTLGALRNKAIDAAVALHEFALPVSLVERTYQQMQQNKQRDLAKDEVVAEAEQQKLREQAESVVKRDLFLRNFIIKQKLEPEQARIEGKIQDLVSIYGTEVVQRLFKGNENSEVILRNIQDTVLIEMAADGIIAVAQVNDKVINFSEFTK